MTQEFYYTVTRNEIRSYMRAVPVLVSASGWAYESTRSGRYYLRTPPLPPHVTMRAGDCGGLAATVRWGCRYRFSPDQYITWLLTWRPQWAIIMDLCSVNADDTGRLVYAGPVEVRKRQRYGTDMAHYFWAYYQPVPIALCPTIQGYHLEEYAHHARLLKPLITEMLETYDDPVNRDDDLEEEQSAFRVCIGSLCGRSPQEVWEIVAVVRSVLGSIPIHLLGTKLAFLNAPIEGSHPIHSLDSAAWNDLWGETHEVRRASGLTEAQYCWERSYPRYADRLARASRQPKFRSLLGDEAPAFPFDAGEYPTSLPRGLCYRESGDGSGGQTDLGDIPSYTEIRAGAVKGPR